MRALIGVLVCAVTLWASPPQRPAAEIIAELQQRFDSFEAVSCDFTQRKRVQQLQAPLEFRGSMIFQKPGFLRAEFRGDENYDVYANGETVWLVDMDFEEVETYPMGSDGSSRLLRWVSPAAFLSPEELQERYQIASLPAERERYRLRLEPNATDGIEAILLEIDGLYRTRWMRVEYAGGDWTETEFSGWNRHGRVSRHIFEYRGH